MAYIAYIFDQLRAKRDTSREEIERNSVFAGRFWVVAIYFRMFKRTSWARRRRHRHRYWC